MITYVMFDAQGNEWITTMTEIPVFYTDNNYNYEYIEYQEEDYWFE